MSNPTVPIVSIFLVAIATTLVYGWVALFGAAYVGEILKVWMGTHVWKKEVYSYEYVMVMQGACGVVGIIGLWLSGIFYTRLISSFSMLNIFVVILLIFGATGAVFLFVEYFVLFIEDDLSQFPYYFAPLLLVSCFSCFLIYRFMMPNRSLQPTASGGG